MSPDQAFDIAARGAILGLLAGIIGALRAWRRKHHASARPSPDAGGSGDRS
jgi:hypothetical protein